MFMKMMITDLINKKNSYQITIIYCKGENVLFFIFHFYNNSLFFSII